MVWSVAEPSTICTSSSPFGWRSHAPSPANFALKILPSRNGANVAKAPLPFRSTSVICGASAQQRQFVELGLEIQNRDHSALHETVDLALLVPLTRGRR